MKKPKQFNKRFGCLGRSIVPTANAMRLRPAPVAREDCPICRGTGIFRSHFKAPMVCVAPCRCVPKAEE